MLKIAPIITEKSLKDAKNGKYTFKFPVSVNKFQVKKTINELFNVHVKKVWIMGKKARKETTLSRRIKHIKAYKKAIVRLQEKEKIDVFELKNK